MRQVDQDWLLAVIEPRVAASAEKPGARNKSRKTLLALPKGLVDNGEKPDQTAIREVREETGLTVRLVAKLADIKYVYVRTWSDHQRVFKIVSFYLLCYESGEIDDVSAAMRIEVTRALWVPLAKASSLLSYRGERDVARKAIEYLETHPLM